MNRFYSIFLVAAFSCTLTFAQSTNVPPGTGTETIGFTNLSFSGETGVDAAALSSLLSFYSTNTAYQGGTGPDLSGNVDLVATGGSGLRLVGVSSAKVVGSELIGADAGSVNQENPTKLATAVGGHGVVTGVAAPTPFAPPISLEVAGLLARGGNGGNITATTGSFENLADGGAGISVRQGKVKVDIVDSTLYGGDGGTVVSGGTESSSAKGGSGLSIEKKPFTKFESAVFNNVMAFGGRGGSITALGEADASGGHGVGITQPSGLIVLDGGTYVGGSGGSVSGASSASANGGDGFRYIGKATETINSLIISNGTFQGAAGGTVSGIAGAATADGGYGLYVENATVEIHGGDFSGSAAGTANGTAGTDGVGLGLNNSSVDIFGGTFDNVRLAGDGASDLTFTNGTIEGELLLAGTETTTYDLSLVGTNAVIVDGISQIAGTANINQWSDQHFTDTTIYGGTMNFKGQSFNLTGGSSLALLRPDSDVNFIVGFTAVSGSQITTTYDGTTHSTVKGGALVFDEGAKWSINGTDTITNGTKITMATGTSLVSHLNASDVNYIGGSWAGGLSVDDDDGQNLIGTYGYVPIQDGLGLEPGTEFYNAMEQLSDLTSFTNSPDDQFAALKDPDLSQERADLLLREQFVNNPMVGAVIQLQGLFADQIKDRTRSHLRYKSSAGLTRSPKGAQGPDWPTWDARGSLKSADESAPSWDVSQSMRNMDDKAPRWDVSQSMRNMDDAAPKSAGDSIKLPATYQVWGRGYGSYLEQDNVDDLLGYHATMGGAVLGLDKRFNNLLLGLGGGYAKTRLKGENGGGEDEADTLYGTLYTAIAGEKGFIDFNLNYAFNEVETKGSEVTGSYESDYDASTFSMYLGGGWGFSTFNDSVLITPEASLLTTYYTRGGYTETATSPDPWSNLRWDSYDQWSYLSSLGATFSSIHQFESFNLEMEFQPEIRAHWLHEFNADMDNDSYVMGSNVNDPIGVAIHAREEDLVKVGTGVRFSKWGSDTLEFGLDLDGVFGEGYEAYIVSGKLLHRF